MTVSLTIKKIRFKNFLATGNTFTEIDFLKAKRTVIVGLNGHGKSQTLDALCYSLFNRSFRGTKKQEQLINFINNKDMLVELEFYTNGSEYMIRRGLKPAVFEIHKNGELIPPPDKKVDYQKMLEEQILGLKFETFCRSCLLGYANYIPFMRLSQPQRRAYVEDVLDLHVFKSMNDLVKKDVKLYKEKSYAVQTQIDLKEKEIEVIEAANARAQSDNQQMIDAKQEQIEALASEIKDLTEKQLKIDKALAILDEAIKPKADVALKLREVERALDKVEHRANEIDKKLSFYEKNDSCPTCKQSLTFDYKDHMCAQDREEKRTMLMGSVEQEKEKHILEAQMVTIRDAESKREKFSRQRHEITIKVKGHNNQIKVYSDERDTLMKRSREIKDVSEQKRELGKLKREKKAVVDRLAALDAALSILSDSGAKTYIIKQYMPIINKMINTYLAKMEFFAKFSLDEEFNETIKARHRDDSSYESFSEGEKLRVNIAVLLAWRDLAQFRNSSSVNILIMDEVLDASLDVEGVDKFMGLLMDAPDGDNIIVISHKAEVANSGAFDRALKVHKKRFTKIEEVMEDRAA